VVNVHGRTDKQKSAAQRVRVVGGISPADDCEILDACKNMLGSSTVKLMDTIIFGDALRHAKLPIRVFPRGEHVGDGLVGEVRQNTLVLSKWWAIHAGQGCVAHAAKMWPRHERYHAQMRTRPLKFVNGGLILWLVAPSRLVPPHRNRVPMADHIAGEVWSGIFSPVRGNCTPRSGGIEQEQLDCQLQSPPMIAQHPCRHQRPTLHRRIQAAQHPCHCVHHPQPA
jgi:hypothetical protein